MSAELEVLDASRQLLAAIDKQDWGAYSRLCDPSITAFEPEAEGHLVSGMPFHKFYFPEAASPSGRQSTISSPHVRVVGDCAVVSYVRLTQSVDAGGAFHVRAMNETRVWEKKDGRWQHVHFHRSPCRIG